MKALRTIVLISLCFFMLLGASGCIFSSGPTIVKHPDASFLIEEVDGESLKIAVYDKKNNRLITYGWIETDGLAGWTVHKFDWEKFINGQ